MREPPGAAGEFATSSTKASAAGGGAMARVGFDGWEWEAEKAAGDALKKEDVRYRQVQLFKSKFSGRVQEKTNHIYRADHTQWMGL